VDAFGPNNLLLVDEGHRGASGEAWRELRRRLAEDGFTFEYSATFGQIVNGASSNRRSSLLDEYTKAILLDYSYPHFYEDGYGKDYWITNLKDESGEFNEWMLLGNLLSFYQQSVVFDNHREELRPYNVDKPLWVFVGHTVTGGRTSQDDKASLTDVEQLVSFLDRFHRSRPEWVQNITRLLEGRSGLKNQRDEDVFEGLFAYLKSEGISPQTIYEDIVKRIFNATPGDALRAVELKGTQGEIGLRVGPRSPYFGVINIGDVAGLIKWLEGAGIVHEEDSFSGSLFGPINEADSPVNVLIGSRKFMEGWDSFRVANMGLMNIGRGEGPQIIQLFGRGVRLWGRGYSLKRSSALNPSGAPPSIRMLETLNIFGVRANYMDQFRKYLTDEGIETDFEELQVDIELQEEFLQRGLHMPRLPNDERYQDLDGTVLDVDGNISVTLDLRPRLEVARSGTEDYEEAQKAEGRDQAGELKKLMPLFDWDRIQFAMLWFKQVKGYNNLAFTRERLQQILQQGQYQVLLAGDRPIVSDLSQLGRAEELAISVLRKYAASYYERCRKDWEQDNMRLATLDDTDDNLSFGSYTLRVKADNRDFVNQVRKLITQAKDIYEKDIATFPNIYFDRHLYQPLLYRDKNDSFRSVPAPLNDGEAQFVWDLRNHLHTNGSDYKDKEFYLLRNLTRGRGIGFFQSGEGEAFYPDFILWAIQGRNQWITFIDPHGLRYAMGGFNDPKIQLHQHLGGLQARLQSQTKEWDIRLNCFIVSTSCYEDLAESFGEGRHSREDFEANNVVFQEDDSEYIKKLLTKAMS
jgi:hypothetical protein